MSLIIFIIIYSLVYCYSFVLVLFLGFFELFRDIWLDRTTCQYWNEKVSINITFYFICSMNGNLRTIKPSFC